MSKLSLVNREAKKRRIQIKYAERVEELKHIISDTKADEDSKDAARLKLEKMPRNAHKVRQRNRCYLTGRPRGYFRRFGLGRNKLRELAMNGEVPGVIKASW